MLESIACHALGRFKPQRLAISRKNDLRRRLEWIAPLFLIAVLGQYFAPVAAGFAMARAPLDAWQICAQNIRKPLTPAGRDHHTGECCAFCAQALAGFVFYDAPRTPAAALTFAPMSAPMWTRATLPRAGAVSIAKARAPPIFS
jgi:hypothetical protein